MAKKEGLYFCLAVWGEEYTGLFLDYCLPSQLAEGNLPAIARMLPCIYRIFATPQDAEKILNHWTFVQLRKIMSTEVIQIDAEIGSDPHQTVNIFHETAVLDAREKSEWLVFLTPDNLWANMSFKNLGDILLANNISLQTIYQFYMIVWGHLQVQAAKNIPLGNRVILLPEICCQALLREEIRMKSLNKRSSVIRMYFWM